jgi:phosphoglycolate phosphatase
MKSTIVFDFDGTIADTFTVVLDIFHRLERRTKPLTEEEQVLMRGAALMQVRLRSVIRAASRLDVPFWRLPFLFAVAQFLLRRRMHEVQPYPGMPELIKQLAAEGHTLFIVSSNSSHNIKKFLKAQNLQKYFTTVYGDVRPQKKAKMLKHIVGKKKRRAKKAWLVGDEDRDIRAGKSAGMTTVAVSWGYNSIFQLQEAKPKRIVTTADALSKILRK